MNQDFSPTFATNVAIHAFAISLVVWSAAKCLSNPNHRSQVAAIGMLAIGVLPWFCAAFVPYSTKSVPEFSSVIETPSTDEGPTVWRDTPRPSSGVQFESGESISGIYGNFALSSYSNGLMIFWILGILVSLGRFTAGFVRMGMTTSSLRQATDFEKIIIFKHAPDCRIRVSPTAVSPFVTGLIRPTLVIPERLLHPAQTEKLAWAMRHEAGHILGHDLRWLAIFQLVRAIFWWNPFISSIQHIWSEAREWICDDLALTSDPKRKEYAEFLISLSAQPRYHTVMPMASRGSIHRMKRRLHHIMEERCHPSCSRSFRVMLGLALCLISAAVSQIGLKAENSAAQSDSREEKPMDAAISPESRPAPASESRDSSVPDSKTLPQIKLTSRMIFSSSSLAAGEKIIPAAELDDVIKRLTGLKADVRELPSITSLQAKSALLEIITEHPENPPRPPIQPNSGDEPPLPGSGADWIESYQNQTPIYDPSFQFVGIRLFYQPRPDGENIRLTCKVDYRHFASTPNAPDPLKGQKHEGGVIPWGELLSCRASVLDTRMRPGDSLWVDFGEIIPGKHASLVVTAVPLDRTGMQIANFSLPQPIPEHHAVPPAVNSRIDGFIIDAATNIEFLPPNGALASLYSNQQVTELKKSFKGARTEIPFTLLKASREWQKISEELPDLRLMVRGWGKEKFLPDMLIAIRQDQVWGLTLNLNSYADHHAAIALPASATYPRRILFLRVNPVSVERD
jgi:beta-lactamase regulating signal transducer with metallopeptidase domain